jgi:hypothetical protein
MILKRYGGLNFKVVAGYRGSARAVAAVQRGEAHGRAGSLPALLRYSDVIKVVIGNTRARRLIPELIVDKEIVTSEEGRSLIDATKVSQRIGRGIMAPPGVPQERRKILESAWNQLRHNPKFLQEMKKTAFINPEDFITAQEVQTVIARVKSIPERTWKVLKQTIQHR